MNIGWMLVWWTDHRIVCKIRQKLGFRQTFVESIRPSMGCRRSLKKRRRHGVTDNGELYCWKQIYYN